MKALLLRLRDGFVFGAGAVLALGLTALFAQTFTQFGPGDLVSSTKINENFQVAAPSGLIGAFALTTCPSGWTAADGANGTPDLRGVFLRGLNNFGSAAGIRMDGMQDPDGGARVVEDFQWDAFQGHYHSMFNYTNSGGSPAAARFFEINAGYTTGSQYVDNIRDARTGGHGGIRVSTESRPRNVAVVFCIRD